MNRAGVHTKLSPRVRAQASQGLKMLMQLLSLNEEELRDQIAQEVEGNPALEFQEEEVFYRNGEKIEFCSYDGEAEDFGDGGSWEFESDYNARLAVPALELHEHVRGQLALSLPEDLMPIADYLVDSLDSQGFLRTDVEEVALQLNCTLEQVERVLAELHRCDPPGIGARNLQESLLLQAKTLQRSALSPQQQELLDVAIAILERAWHELCRNNRVAIAKRLQEDETLIAEALEFIRSELKPYPAEGFEFSDPVSDHTPSYEPDIIVRRSPAGLAVEVRGRYSDSIRLSPIYREQYEALRKAQHRLSPAESEHIIHYVSQAKIFIKALQQRYQTLKRVAEAIVRREFNFIQTGDPRFLFPLTRAELAEETGLHRSTIGRAVRNKRMQLPDGTVVPLDIFFDASYRVALMIQQIIQRYETPNRLLSDAEIADYLHQHWGIQIARRTVGKYRQQHRILSSRWRERERLVG
ncbi:MAG: hypothetical protein SNJ72_04680 [Fimbriimonadales bacterium]